MAKGLVKKVRTTGRKVYRAIKKGGKYVKRELSNRYGGYGLIGGGMKLAQDIAMVKGILNAEKKRYRITSSETGLVGQVEFVSSGHEVIDATPYISQGVTATTRNGASLKLTSSYIQFQYYQQGGTNHPMKIKMFYLWTDDADMTISDVAPRFLLPNRWIQNYNGGINVYDFQSARNMDHYKNFKVLSTKTFVMRADSLSGQTQVNTVRMPIRYNRGKGQHVRYDTNSNTVTNGKFFILILADTGNCDPVQTSTLSGVPIGAHSTGAFLNWDILHYYVDN